MIPLSVCTLLPQEGGGLIQPGNQDYFQPQKSEREKVAGCLKGFLPEGTKVVFFT